AGTWQPFAANVKPARKIRWYGLPRDTSGDGLVDINDVIPARDVAHQYGAAAGFLFPFEKEAPTQPTALNASTQTYEFRNDANYNTYSALTVINYRYSCIWVNAGGTRQ